MSNDAAFQTTSKDVDELYESDVVYTSGQMLEIHPENCHFCHFSGPPARLPGGTARSARRCSIMRSDMTSAGPRHPKTEWVWVHRNCHTDFRCLCSISHGSEWRPTRARWRDV
jgi:hypothetical protein